MPQKFALVAVYALCKNGKSEGELLRYSTLKKCKNEGSRRLHFFSVAETEKNFINLITWSPEVTLLRH